MNENNKYNEPDEPRLRDTLKNDISRSDHFKTFKSELKDVKEFYLSSEKKRRLGQKKWYSRWFYTCWWVFKGMILRLSPLRRIIMVIGILFLLSSTVVINNTDDSSRNRAILGGVIIIFVLMLELKDKQLAHNELIAGRKIQEKLMPAENPLISGWDVWMYSKPANEICGDLIDYVEVTKDKYALFLADVAGKGLNAALFTTKLQASIRTVIYDLRLEKLVSKVNEIFFKEKYRFIFASLFYTEIQPGHNEIEYVNAGHLPPVLLRTSGPEELPKGNAAIGLIPNENYMSKAVSLNSGDFMIVFSDGVTEAMNNAGNLYGKERFYKFISARRNLTSKELGEDILKEIEQFLNYSNPSDDLSLIIIKKNI
ncbi:MAG: serine/threonine-protein phosphatase [Ignavibacteria bacterium]|nr:serine/threonine-protein phosphatase [Ignavibacteria bacterium]